MDFALEAINEAHAKYTGVEFPKLVREFKLMGMNKNEYIIEKGLSIYVDNNGRMLEKESNDTKIEINSETSKDRAKEVLKRHQAGETDFITFCKEMAEAGVYRWVTDIEKLTCSYYSKAGNLLIVEDVPIA